MMRLNAPHPIDHDENDHQKLSSGREARREHSPLRGCGVEAGAGVGGIG